MSLGGSPGTHREVTGRQVVQAGLGVRLEGLLRGVRLCGLDGFGGGWGRGLQAAGEPDAGDPEGGEDDAEHVHGRDDHARGDDQGLQDRARPQRPAHARAADQAAEDQGAHGQATADAARDAVTQVLHDDGDRDGEPDDDGFHDQDGAAQLPQLLHDSSAAVNEWREGWVADGSAGSSPPAGASRRRASPAVMTDPVTSTPPLPGPVSATASSASETAISIASSSRSADWTRSSPKISTASSAVCSGSRERSEELRVTTMSVSSGSSSARMPGTSLSPLAANTPVRRAKLNASSTPATVAAIPAGLCAASMMMVGLRLTTSRRPGELAFANDSRTRSASSGAPSSETPANASTAASAQAALPAWCRPNSGRY